MTNDELEAVRARAEAATPGPWEWRWDAVLGQWSLAPGVLLADGTDGTPGGDKIDVENAEFIAHARTDIPALLDDVAEWRQAASVEANQRREAEARATRAEAHAERLAGAVIEGREIVIRVPLDNLQSGIDGAWMLHTLSPRYLITNVDEFAADLVISLNDEDEEGTTRVHKMLDAAVNHAIENGAFGIEEHPEQDL